MARVIKANGNVEEYNRQKILRSIQRTGIPENLQNDLLEHVSSKIYDNIPTREIFGHVYHFLGKSKYPYSKTAYGLKQAIMELGPTGYPFEDFVSEVLISLGYKTEVRQIYQGKCISHEIDVIARKDHRSYMVEAKFHNAAGTCTDVHVPMYTKARLDDVSSKHHFSQAWIVTNTNATTDAVAFAECVGMKIISWNYQDGGSLRDLIEKAGLHPITILTTLTQGHKVKLLDNHIVRCKNLHQNPDILSILPLSSEEKQKVLEEIEYVCRGEHDS